MDQQVRDSAPISRRTLYRATADRPSAAVGLPRLLAFIGPGYLVAVGYIDPGNWATDIAAGSAFGYHLVWVVMLAGVMAMLLQGLSLKLGIVTGQDLATACRLRYSRSTVVGLWALSECAIIATDIAEILGSAIALQLLFRLPLLGGVFITVLDVLLVLALQRSGMRRLEAVVVGMIAVVAVCFIIELVLARPSLHGVLAGMVPHVGDLARPGGLFLALGIVGATIMPHNLYLHSALVVRTPGPRSAGQMRRAVRLAFLDSTVALSLALLINAAILVLAAAAFHAHGHTDIATLPQAYSILTPLFGTAAAGVIFAIGLLASGQNSTLTGTLAGQVVMDGFLQMRLKPAMQRLITRCLAIIPAALVIIIGGEGAVTRLLLLSQVILALQLPFAAVPLLRLTSDPKLMGPHANGWWTRCASWGICLSLGACNLILMAQVVAGMRTSP